MPYISDRQFTDYVHSHLAVDIIYPRMDWVVQDINGRLGQNIDINNAVDYMAVERQSAHLVTIQERFREMKFSRYTDFTIRYMRPENSHEDRRLSEYFKLDADYFIYGIINTSKDNYTSATGFLKFAILDLAALKVRIDDGSVFIDTQLSQKRCSMQGNTMHCPVIENYDHSSNFVPFDICMLNNIAPEVIICQEGFI